MKLDRQTYKDATYEQAQQLNYDCIQLKYDGWWARVVCLHGEGKIFSRTQRQVATIPVPAEVNGTFIGEYLFGTQWSQKPDRLNKLMLFDCWELGGTSLLNAPYRDRYKILRHQHIQLSINEDIRLVGVFRMSDFPTVWDLHVEKSNYEGVVFRKMSDVVESVLLRQKKSYTVDVFITDFEPGEPGGRHEHRLGALVCQTRDGTIIRVGGGLSDDMRDRIWNDKESYRGRWLTAEGKARFESGSLRHPNFKEWREDLV